MVRTLLFFGLGLASLAAMAQSRQLVPTVYEAGHFYAVPKTTSGQSLRLLVDTGGGGGRGFFVIDPTAANRAGLAVSSCAFSGQRFQVISPISFAAGNGLPLSLHTPCNAAALVMPGMTGPVNGDGQLGAGYLPGRIWTFDYPKRQLWVEPPTWKPGAAMHRVPLGFLINSHGGLGSGFARIGVKVAGKPIDLLLDTGATAKPTAAGERAGHAQTHNGLGVTSYITTSVLERWHREHPDWRVVTDSDQMIAHTRLIEVPKIELAGWRLGPVWFTERPDANFSAEGNFRYIDGPIVGALGANVFRHFEMTIDYPKRAAWFDCIEGCSPSANDRLLTSVHGAQRELQAIRPPPLAQRRVPL